MENAEERTVASVYKHKLSKNWWGRAYRNGKEIRVSLRTTSKVEANKRLAQWVYDLDNGSYQTGCNYTYDQLAELFITEYIPTLKEQRRYVTSLRMLTPYFKQKKLDEISGADLWAYYSARILECKEPTINRDLACLSSMYGFAQINLEWDINNPVLVWKKQQQNKGKLKESPPRTRYLNHHEQELLIEATHGTFRDALILCLYTGLRADELWALTHDPYDNEKPNHVDLYNSRLIITGKGNKQRKVPLLPEAKEVLERARQVRHITSPYVFFNPSTGTRFKDRKRGMDGAVERAKIQRITWHDVRRTYGCRMLNDRKLTMQEVSLLLGHSSVRVTQERYAFLEEDKVHDKLLKTGE